MTWYDLNTKQENKKQYLARVKYDDIICKKASSFKEIIDGELVEGLQYRIVTEQSFNAITIIEYLFNFYEIEEIHMVVYRMNTRSVDKIKSIIDSKKVKCNIIVSSFFKENKRFERWAKDLVMFAETHSQVKIAFAWNHAKIFLAKTKCGKHIVFEGSGNLSDNALIEQYIIENNKKTYSFHRDWINDILYGD